MSNRRFYYLQGTKIAITNCKLFEGTIQLEKTLAKELTISTVFSEVDVDHIEQYYKNFSSFPFFQTAVFEKDNMISSFRSKNYHKAIENHWIIVDRIRKYKNLKSIKDLFLNLIK